MIRVGTAGWSIPKALNPASPRSASDTFRLASGFVGDGPHLERYARVMRAVEIDTSFYRPHRGDDVRSVGGDDAGHVPFAVKLPRTVTHDARLVGVESPLDRFFAEVAGLGARLGVVLAQLPPSLAFDERVADDFFAALRARHDGAVVCEPRHRSWFTPQADALLAAARVTRVAADPASVPEAFEPGGWLGPDGDGRDATVYYRWHGSPRMYWSAYDDAWLAARATGLSRWPVAADVWCIFDNTAAGAALADALRLRSLIDAVSANA